MSSEGRAHRDVTEILKLKYRAQAKGFAEVVRQALAAEWGEDAREWYELGEVNVPRITPDAYLITGDEIIA